MKKWFAVMITVLVLLSTLWIADDLHYTEVDISIPATLYAEDGSTDPVSGTLMFNGKYRESMLSTEEYMGCLSFNADSSNAYNFETPEDSHMLMTFENHAAEIYSITKEGYWSSPRAYALIYDPKAEQFIVWLWNEHEQTDGTFHGTINTEEPIFICPDTWNCTEALDFFKEYCRSYGTP